MSTDSLRIVLILENAGAGSGRHVIDLARGLLERGNAVTVLYSPGRLEQWFADAIDQTDGLRSQRIDMVRGPSLLDFAALAEIRRFLRRHGNPDVIHGHSSKGGALARLGGIFTGAARVYTPHAFYTLDPELSTARRAFYAMAERLLGVLAHGVICVSEAERRHAVSLGLPARKLRVVQNCLAPLPPADRAEARRQLGLEDAEICIGFVGRLAPQKAIGQLLTAFARVAEHDRLARLVIVGAGPEDTRLRERAQALGIQPRVTFTGHADGPALMAGFDVFALPSRYEAFPYVLLEAAARGLPIVTTRVGGAEEVVHDGVNGYIVESTDQLSDRLQRLVQQPQQRHAMRRASLDRAGTFTVDRMVGETLRFYRALVADIH